MFLRHIITRNTYTHTHIHTHFHINFLKMKRNRLNRKRKNEKKMLCTGKKRKWEKCEGKTRQRKTPTVCVYVYFCFGV